MSRKITVYDLLISCSSDVSQYVELLIKEVSRFNNTFGRSHDVVIRTRYWKEDVYPEAGNQPQQLINKQIVDESDMVLSVFWTRFGTPTENYGSGTEEEIERMLSMNKQIFMYFLDKPIEPSKIDSEQYRKIREFKENYQKRAICFSVQDEKELASKFGENLEIYFDSVIRRKEIKKEKIIKKILWVDDYPENNRYERDILENYGLSFCLALTTDEALWYMEHRDFSLVISDMGRKEGGEEGFALLNKIRKKDKDIPVIIYTSSKNVKYVDETIRLGGQGLICTPKELINSVMKHLLQKSLH